MTKDIIEDLVPGLGGDLEKTSELINKAYESGDVVMKFLATQWNASMQALPQLSADAPPEITRRLITHLGAIALILERLNFDGSQYFMNVAGGILRVHIGIFGENLERNGSAPSGLH